MTVPGIDATVALSIVAAVGDFTRFRTPDKLVSLPRAQPAGAPVRRAAGHSRPDHQGRPGAARGMLVEAAWSASKAPGLLAPRQCRDRLQGPALLPGRARPTVRGTQPRPG